MASITKTIKLNEKECLEVMEYLEPTLIHDFGLEKGEIKGLPFQIKLYRWHEDGELHPVKSFNRQSAYDMNLLEDILEIIEDSPTTTRQYYQEIIKSFDEFKQKAESIFNQWS